MNKLKRLFLTLLLFSAAFLFMLPVFNSHQVWAQECTSGSCWVNIYNRSMACTDPDCDPVCDGSVEDGKCMSTTCHCVDPSTGDPPDGDVTPPDTPSLGGGFEAALRGGLTHFVKFAIGIAGGFALLLLIYGGIKYVTSAGKPDEIKEAQSIITAAIIGLLVVLLSVLILSTMSDALGLQWGS